MERLSFSGGPSTCISSSCSSSSLGLTESLNTIYVISAHLHPRSLVYQDNYLLPLRILLPACHTLWSVQNFLWFLCGFPYSYQYCYWFPRFDETKFCPFPGELFLKHMLQPVLSTLVGALNKQSFFPPPHYDVQ